MTNIWRKEFQIKKAIENNFSPVYKSVSWSQEPFCYKVSCNVCGKTMQLRSRAWIRRHAEAHNAA